jgi:hypothetical protein
MKSYFMDSNSSLSFIGIGHFSVLVSVTGARSVLPSVVDRESHAGTLPSLRPPLLSINSMPWNGQFLCDYAGRMLRKSCAHMYALFKHVRCEPDQFAVHVEHNHIASVSRLGDFPLQAFQSLDHFVKLFRSSCGGSGGTFSNLKRSG